MLKFVVGRAFLVPLAIILTGCATGSGASNTSPSSPVGDDVGSWTNTGRAAVEDRLAQTPNVNQARNVILFIGDGMGLSTITAARIYDGQSRGKPGEEHTLSFETFPHTALVKTYNTDQQVADSAGTASAMHTGVKTRAGVVGLSGAAPRAKCAQSMDHRVATLGEMAAGTGKATGIVTTTRLTHATPAAVYAHSSERDWEMDSNMPAAALDEGCRSIARQFVEFDTGKGIDVALGGGRSYFSSELVDVWRSRYPDGTLVHDRNQLAAIGAGHDGPVWGLFSGSHMTYMLDRAGDSTEPTLSEMTAKAIDILSDREGGYYLMIEGGRIDHGHHDGIAGKALAETQEFARAVQVALDRVDLDDTLILVTADHSHVLSFGGYPTRGNPILGHVVGNDKHGSPEDKAKLALDDKPYTALGYHNGPGAVAGQRPVPDTGPFAMQQAVVPTGYRHPDRIEYSETHAGEDVALFAVGPWSHLASGVMEQHVIFHMISHAFGW
ncbi:MAG: alkaline phosphatase [Sphingomonadales bacterium]